MKDPSGTSDGWTELGRDAAADYRCGPSMGTKNIRVRYRPERPGDYDLRASIITYAIPENSIVMDSPDPNFVSGRNVVVRNQANIRLRVIEQPAAQPLPYEEPTGKMPEELQKDH